ncbi:hypothetical protein PIB30_024706 [Stylosanthes scabra]|uniref:Uncharacterized protein n=1 Tax=Stylosanthes scabra TaxID=79078 RepID=A0ABU6RA94_9FABA|nr:hypothetical protein [Stylosanthes scabra]
MQNYKWWEYNQKFFSKAILILNDRARSSLTHTHHTAPTHTKTTHQHTHSRGGKEEDCGAGKGRSSRHRPERQGARGGVVIAWRHHPPPVSTSSLLRVVASRHCTSTSPHILRCRQLPIAPPLPAAVVSIRPSRLHHQPLSSRVVASPLPRRASTSLLPRIVTSRRRPASSSAFHSLHLKLVSLKVLKSIWCL